jgi:hypothetical protein
LNLENYKPLEVPTGFVEHKEEISTGKYFSWISRMIKRDKGCDKIIFAEKTETFFACSSQKNVITDANIF